MGALHLPSLLVIRGLGRGENGLVRNLDLSGMGEGGLGRGENGLVGKQPRECG